MNIVDYFDPYNEEHLKAYRHLSKVGYWPSGFTAGLQTPPSTWIVGVTEKMAKAWADNYMEIPNLAKDVKGITDSISAMTAMIEAGQSAEIKAIKGLTEAMTVMSDNQNKMISILKG